MKPDVVRRLFMTFLFAGLFGAASQLLLIMWRGLLGADSVWAMPAMLLTLGFAGAVLYALGAYHKLEEIGSMGAVMPFSGLVSAVAAAFEEGHAKRGDAGGAGAGFAFFLYVLGVGSCIAAVVGAICALA